MMTLLEAIYARHSVRRYISRPLEREAVDCLRAKIDECNSKGNLHIQLVLNERKGFSGMLAYGSFSGVENYIVMAGRRADDLDERVGYYGEQIVLLAQQLGLGTCWAGLSYRKVKGAYALDSEEKVACMISLGYPDDAGRKHKCKSVEDVSNAGVSTPEWFEQGVRAALKAPTAVNQQKFYIEYAGVKDGRHCVCARRLFSMVGYTSMDLGIVKLHFEIGAGKDNFEWV
ncbi:nitroreductase family protein [Leyella lascolaii]|uniref:nitroreductase family protein n=1 Tax=Leyella lascolaii TaxID=1776379 RepID=UPI001F12A7EE|nr:nitroreductase family protein [Leyella lascolaii]